LSVAPLDGTVDAIQAVTFTLNSTQLQARASEYTTKFSLLSNSRDEADRNLTIITSLLVSAEPVARLSNATLHNPSDVVAGGSLSFHLTLVDLTHIEILDAFDVAYSAVLTHLDSATSVPCSVLYDTKSERHQGGCDVPSLVCTDDDARADCELSPPVGEFVLEVNDTQGMLVGASRHPFTVGICPELYYQRDAKCVVCPEHVTCPAGSTIASWQLDSGFWRTGGTSTKVYECAYGVASCPGHGNGMNSATDPYCAPEYVGPLCSECADNFFIGWNGDGVCYECAAGKSHHPTIALWVAVVVVVCVAAAGTTFACRNRCADNKNDDNPTTTETAESGCFATFSAHAVLLYRVGQLKLFNLLIMCQVENG